MMSTKHVWQWAYPQVSKKTAMLAAMALSLLLPACGGGGNTSTGSGTTTASSSQTAPTVTISLTSSSLIAGQSTQLSWSSSGANSCSATGAWTGTQATTGSITVTQSKAGNYAYNLNCTGSGGTGNASTNLTVAGNNTATIVIDNGPAGISGGSINVPFVTVSICRPGTSICQTIDHVLLDTGSYGLRLAAPLDTALALPVVTAPSGAAAGECAQFVSGYAWGAVRQADVKIADEVALSQSVHILNSAPAGYSGIPASCSSAGANIGSVAALGANGILGVGLFKQDCGDSCVSSSAGGAYYACTASSCLPSTMPLAQQVSNPVSAFAVNNNGVVLSFPAVPTGGLASMTGTLIFGIDTQVNNKLGNATTYTTNTSGNFSTTYKGVTMASSFLDSGSNGLYFNDASIVTCRIDTGFYCPTSLLNLSATNTGANGNSGIVNFTIENLENLGNTITVSSIGGTNGRGRRSSANSSFDWGLPFFFGRRVIVGFEKSVNGVAQRPYWAY